MHSIKAPFSVAAVTLSLFAGLMTAAAPVSAQSPQDFPLRIAAEVHFPPSPINAAGTHHYIYEIHLTSYTPQPANLTRVEVFAENRQGPSLLVYEGQELIDNMGPIGRSFDEGEEHRATVIEGWSHAMIYLFAPIEPGLALPYKLHHVLTFDVESESDRYTKVLDVSTAVLPRSETVQIGPPLTGGPWVALNGPGNESGHRRMPLPLNGRPALAQRYAIDYMKIDAEGHFYTGDKTKNESYAGFGQEVIAVGDGIISMAFDEVPENTPFVSSRPEVFNLQTAIGNHLILDLGDGRYVLYAHLKRGAVRVKEGDYVRRGQVLGLVGNTGNSGGPHLHFHLIDQNVPLGAEGLPFVHTAFEWLGPCEISELSDACDVGAGERRVGQTPMMGDIVRFPE